MKNCIYTKGIVEYSDAYFEDLQMSEEEMVSVYFDDCVFDGCDFSYSSLLNCTFNNCTFKQCNMSLVKIPNTYFQNVSFEKCDMIGIDWTVARWLQSVSKRQKYSFPIRFDDCRLNHSIFIALNLSNAVFDTCLMREVVFEEAFMVGAKFQACDLENSIFKNTILREADFSSAKNYDINARENDISKARFSLPEAMSLIYSLDIKIESRDDLD